MSTRVVAIAAVSAYTLIYLGLMRSVPRKSRISFLSRLRVHYATTDWSFWMEWMQAVFSIGTVVLYVVASYYWGDMYTSFAMKLEVFFSVFYAFNFLFELILSKNRWAFVLSLVGIVDIVTTVPVFVALATPQTRNSPTGFVRFYRVIMLSRVFKPFRLMRVVDIVSSGQDAVMEQMVKSIAYFVSTLFLASGLVQAMSDGSASDWGDVTTKGSRPMSFHDALYFIIVTFSTVGYGDISPPDTLSRLAVVLLVAFFFFMIPRELNTLNQLLDLSSKYTGNYPKKLTGGHTIVGCDVATCGLVAAFLEEFFHEDHGYNVMHLVLLVPEEPTMGWKRVVLKFAANDRVTYLKGDLRSTSDLERVSAHTASTCFILSNRHGNLKEEEKRGFMRAIAVQDYNPSIRIFVEALTVGMKNRLIKVGINPARIVCASTINTRMLANACAWEGASTLINNLLVSASIDEQRDMPSWIKEYASGLEKEIYVVSIGAFAGRGFSQLVRELFEQYGVVLLGISEDKRVVVHPGKNYIITQADLGFLVADDANVAESIVEQAGALLPSLQTKGCKRASEGASYPLPSTAASTGPTEGLMTKLGHTLRSLVLGDPRKRGAQSGSGEGGGGGASGGKGRVPDHSFPEDTAIDEIFIDNIYDECEVAVKGGDGPLSSSSPPMNSPQNKSAAVIKKTAGGSGGGTATSDTGSSPRAMAGQRERRQGRTSNGKPEEGYIVLVTPTLAQVSKLVQTLEAPQVPVMGVVVVCPLYEWNQERDLEELRRLRTFPQVRLVVGPASKKVLREAGASGARMVVLRAGKSFPEQEASDADAETIGQLVEVTAAAGNVRTVVELNNMMYGNHYEILVERLRASIDSNKIPHRPASRNQQFSDSASTSHWGSGSLLLGRHCSDVSDEESGDEHEEVITKCSTMLTASLVPAVGTMKTKRRVHWSLSKGFASGAIAPSSLPETLLCQAFYNPAIIMIMEALLDPKAQGRSKRGTFPGDDTEELGSSRSPAEAGGGSGGGGGGASFLAQIAPPKSFFTHAMHNGHRPNFQALMNFMLGEYDILPLGLLRHDKTEGATSLDADDVPKFVHCCPAPEQKVMPLDKVFLLAPNLRSWERIQLDSPATQTFLSPESSTPRLTPTPLRNNQGFPPESRGKCYDERGFPTEHDDWTSLRRQKKSEADREASSPSMEGMPPSPDRYPNNRYLSPLSKAARDEESAKTPMYEEGPSWAISPKRRRFLQTLDETGEGSEISGQQGRGAQGVQVPLPQKGSHVKLDILLKEVQRLNGRLDTIIGSFGGLDEGKQEEKSKSLG